MTLSRTLTLTALSAVFAGLSGCGAPPAPAPPTPAAPGSTATEAAGKPEAEQAAEMAVREANVARREAELAAREAADTQSRSKVASTKPAARPGAKPATPKAAVAGSGSRELAARPPTPPPPPLILPAGTLISVELAGEISTQTARVGDPVEARVASDVMADGRTAIPAGTTVRGAISEVVSGSHKIGGTPTLGLRFDGIELRPGKITALSGNLHEQGKSDTPRDAAKIAGGALIGAILGKQIGDNKGRLIGGLLGGAAGIAAAQKTGTEVVLPAGTPFSVVLDTALAVPGT
jgi:hypothetical protein